MAHSQYLNHFTKIFSCSNIDLKLANNVISTVLMITALQKYYRCVAIVNIIVNYTYQRENAESLKLVTAILGGVTFPGKITRFTVNDLYGKTGGSVSIQFLLD